MMGVTLFGIPNCDTVKKARAWLHERGIAYAFHDYKKSGIEESRLRDWAAAVGWEKLLNRSGTTFRKLPDEAKANLDQERAIAFMREQPSMIRRPVVEHGGPLMVGFDPEAWAQILG